MFASTAVLLGLAGLSIRAYAAFLTPGVLDWDESYYASSTATAAAGIGFYPFVQGYPTIPSMGGVGHVMYLYVIGYKLLGPDLMVLRAIAFAASLAAVGGTSALTGLLFGRSAALAAFAVTPSLFVFASVNSIRLDAMAVAFVAWALVAYVAVAGRPSQLAHALLGALFALGLNVHLHTAAATFAVGLAYLVDTLASRRSTPRSVSISKWRLPSFVAGYLVGALVFLALSVLPGPESYFRSAALARLSAVDSDTSLNLTAPMDSGKLAASFLSPAEIVPKEVSRYGGMFRAMAWWERLLWLAGVPLFLLRRHLPGRFPARVLLPGAVLGGGIVLNSSAPVYFAPLLPFFVPAFATLISDGFRRPGGETTPSTPASAIAILVLAVAMLPTLVTRARAASVVAAASQGEAAPRYVATVTARVSPECSVAGPTNLYARYFMAYPRFTGTRHAEVMIGSTYADLSNDLVAYWQTKAPDVVFGPLDSDLAAFLAAERYEQIADDVWRRPTLSTSCSVAAR